MEFESKQYQTLVESIQKHFPNAFSKEAIKKMIGAGLLDFDSGAKSIENIQEENIVKPEEINNSDEKVKNAVNYSTVKFDIIVNMTKDNDAMLYQTYKNTLNDLQNISKQMVEKSASQFSSMLGHIESLLDEGEGDAEAFKKLKETNLKIL